MLRTDGWKGIMIERRGGGWEVENEGDERGGRSKKKQGKEKTREKEKEWWERQDSRGGGGKIARVGVLKSKRMWKQGGKTRQK